MDITFLDLLPVIYFAILAMSIVEGKNGQLIRIAPTEDLSYYEACREIDARIADSVREIELV